MYTYVHMYGPIWLEKECGLQGVQWSSCLPHSAVEGTQSASKDRLPAGCGSVLSGNEHVILHWLPL